MFLCLHHLFSLAPSSSIFSILLTPYQLTTLLDGSVKSAKNGAHVCTQKKQQNKTTLPIDVFDACSMNICTRNWCFDVGFLGSVFERVLSQLNIPYSHDSFQSSMCVTVSCCNRSSLYVHRFTIYNSVSFASPDVYSESISSSKSSSLCCLLSFILNYVDLTNNHEQHVLDLHLCATANARLERYAFWFLLVA